MSRTIILVDLDNLLRHDPNRRPGGANRHDASPRMTLWVAARAGWTEHDPGKPRARARRATSTSTNDRRLHVVTIAMNVETARVGRRGKKRGGHGVRLTTDYLEELAGTLIDVFSPAPASEYGLELALTPPVAQAADAALIRLLDLPPCSEHAGSFDQVILISADQGLQREIHTRLTATIERTGFDQAPRFEESARVILDGETVGRWMSTGIPLVRPFEYVPDGGVSSEYQTPGPVVFVEGPTDAARAAGDPVDVDGHTDLATIAHLAEDAPAILTQIGPTPHSTRGVARLTRLILDPTGDAVLIGECRALDGLELLRPKHASSKPLIHGPQWTAERSGVGDGCVRVSSRFPGAPRKTATFSFGTRLPTDVIDLALATRRRLELSDCCFRRAWSDDATDGAPRWSTGDVRLRVADDAVLTSVLEIEPIVAGKAMHLVRFEPTGDGGFVARIVFDGSERPRAWWSVFVQKNGRETRAWPDRTTAVPVHLTGAFEVESRLVVFREATKESARILVGSLSAAASSPGEEVAGVRVAEDLPRGSIGPGTVRGKSVAILNTNDRDLRIDEEWTCRPVQFPGFEDRLVRRKAIANHPAIPRLPLIVPMKRE